MTSHSEDINLIRDPILDELQGMWDAAVEQDDNLKEASLAVQDCCPKFPPALGLLISI